MKSRSRVSSPAGFIIFSARNKWIVRESAGNRDAPQPRGQNISVLADA